jgi:hypothetical protein
MRQMISGLVAAVAVMAAAPAVACGFNPCWQPQVYVAPAPAYSYSGCNPCGGWTHERLPDPVEQYGAHQQYGSQYYYVNQGPTYTGPGNWAPRPTYQEDNYERPRVYGYHPHHHYYRPWHHTGYYHGPRMGYHHGYAQHHAYATRYAPAPYHYGHQPLRRYY